MFTSQKTRSGFTIVELLIVIVVIAILAAISIVAYSGIQQRARDSQRTNDIATLQKALEMYHADNGGYPTCLGATYQPGGTRSACSSGDAAFISALSPKYLTTVPKDPINSGESTYKYVFGSKKNGAVTYSATADDNYVLIASIESKGGPYVVQLTANETYNYLVGSSN